MTELRIAAYIDFDNDLDFDDPDEDVTRYLRSCYMRRGSSETLEAGLCELEFHNPGNIFSPLNQDSPFYPRLLIRRRILISIDERDNMDWIQHPLLHGYIDSITPQMVAEEAEEICIVTATDILRPLAERKVTTGTMLGLRTGEVIDRLLDRLSWEGLFTIGISKLDRNTRLGGPGATWRDLDAGQTGYPYVRFDETTVLDAIRDVLTAERGRMYMQRNGRIRFEDRHSRGKRRDITATIYDSLISELTTEYVTDGLYNSVAVTAYPRTVRSAGSVVWDAIAGGSSHKLVGYSEAYRAIGGIGTGMDMLAPGEAPVPTPEWRTTERQYYVNFRDPVTGIPCDAIDIVTPVAGTDYVANSMEDGSGSVRTGQLTILLNSDDTSRYRLLARNNSQHDIYITKLQLRGTPLVKLDPVTMIAQDGESMAQFMQRDLDVTIPLLSSPLQAQDCAGYLLQEHKKPRVRLKRLRLEAGQPAASPLLLSLDIGDRLHIDSDVYAIHGDMFIDGLELEAEAETNEISMSYDLSEAPGIMWKLETDRLDQTAYLTY